MTRNTRSGLTGVAMIVAAFTAVMTASFAGAQDPAQDSVKATVTDAAYGAFTVAVETDLPAPPAEVFDALTGDISGWWDHSFMDRPARFFIEAKPGGGFWEYFDDAGTEGVRHGVVTAVWKNRKLVYQGQLGFLGTGAGLTITYDLAPSEKGTLLKVTAAYAGQEEDGWRTALAGVWKHFILTRFTPYIEAGCHKTAPCTAFAPPAGD